MSSTAPNDSLISSSSLLSAIHRWLPEPSNDIPVYLMTDWGRLPMEEKLAVFKQLRVSSLRDQSRDGHRQRRKLVTLLFAYGQQLPWEGRHVFGVLHQYWQTARNTDGCDDHMLLALSELKFHTR